MTILTILTKFNHFIKYLVISQNYPFENVAIQKRDVIKISCF
jgi:hypothetical protein